MANIKKESQELESEPLPDDHVIIDIRCIIWWIYHDLCIIQILSVDCQELV